MEKGSIAAIILTYNEELHIERCITNAGKYASEIFVVDSYSTDRTVEIANRLGGIVLQNRFISHSAQFNWALENCPISTEWVWKQDADEYLSTELIEQIKEQTRTCPPDVNGFTAPCLRFFLGKYIKHGIVPLILLRLIRRGCGKCETKIMDEHLRIDSGRIIDLKEPFFDDNLNNLTWWTNKHNVYASKEAIELLLMEYVTSEEDEVVKSGAHSASIRRKKLKYVRLPLFWRAFFFFILRYIFRLGFLDGKAGFLWHFHQGFWYRALADAKVFEIKKQFRFDDVAIKQYLIDNYVHTATNE